MFRFARTRILALSLITGVALMTGCAGSDDDADTGAEAELNAAGTVTIVSDSRKIEATYRSTSGPSNGAVQYTMTSSSSRVTSSTTGTGFLASLSKQTKDELDTKVPGQGDLKGHANFTVREVPGMPKLATLALDSLVEIQNDKFVGRVEFKYTADAEFTIGTFADFTAGKTITLRLTEDGEEAVAVAAKRAFEQSMSNLSGQLTATLRAQSPSARSTPLVVDEFKATGHIELTGNSKELKSKNTDPNAVFHSKMHFGISLVL